MAYVTDGALNTKTGFPLYYITNPAISEAFQNLWDNATLTNGKKIWSELDLGYRAVAEKFKSDSAVLGYEILNEPWVGNNWKPCVTGPISECSDIEQSSLDPFYQNVISTIRGVDTKHMIFAEPFVTFNFGNKPSSITFPGTDKNVAMAFHVYPLSIAGETSCVNNALNWSAQNNRPALVTEFDNSLGADATRRKSALFDSQKISFIYWAYSASKKNTEDVGLNEPYPYRLTGELETYSVNFAAGDVVISYYSRNANPPSEIIIPASFYPTGFTYSISGGKLSSVASGVYDITTPKIGNVTLSIKAK